MAIYKPGDLIFGKVRGYIPWPARIEPPKPGQKIPPNKYPVIFFGTYQSAILTSKQIFPYEKFKKKYGKQQERRFFNVGLEEIEQEWNCGKVKLEVIRLSKEELRRYDYQEMPGNDNNEEVSEEESEKEEGIEGSGEEVVKEKENSENVLALSKKTKVPMKLRQEKKSMKVLKRRKNLQSRARLLTSKRKRNRTRKMNRLGRRKGKEVRKKRKFLTRRKRRQAKRTKR